MTLTHQQLKDSLIEMHDDAYSWAVHCCGRDREEALDILQQCYAKVLGGDVSYGGRSSVKTWFFGVIRFTAQTNLRTQKRRLTLLKRWWSQQRPLESVSPQSQHEDREQAEQIRALMARLSAKQCEVLELVFYHDLTLEESAQVMDMPVGTARTHYARGKKKLLHLIQAQPSHVEVSI